MRLSVVPPLTRTLRALAMAFVLAGGSAHAATATYSLLLDTDNDPATGCTVSGPGGPVAGIEQVVTTVVDTTATGATVTRLERQVCSGGALGAPAAYEPGGWAVGFGNGTGGTAVVESSVPLSMLPPGASMRAVATSAGGGGQDVTTAFAVVLQAVGGPGNQVVAVPLSPWLVLPLAVGVFAVALWVRRRYPHHAALAAFLVVFALSGLAWAATVIRDGNVGDWAGVPPAVTDAAGDAPPDADIVAVFYQQDTANLYLRFDTGLRKETVNQAPVVSAGSNQTVTLPAAANLAGSATDDGLPNPPGALTIAWSKVSGPGTVAFGNSASAVTTATFSLAGTYVLRLSANDGALSSSADVTVTVNDVAPPGANQPPVVSAGAAQSIALPASASLTGTATDDGKPTPPGVLATTWSLVSGPGFVTFANPGALATQAQFSAPGVYTLMLTAFDGELSASATTQVTVADGAPQIAPIANRTIVAGTRLQVVIQASDASGDVLTYSLPVSPAGATLSPAPLIDWTPSAAQVGTHAFTVQVADSNGHSASASFNVTVTAIANMPPVLATQQNQIVAIGTTFARKLSANDPDAGEVLTFSLVAGPSGMTLSGADLAWPTAGRSPGDYNVTVRVTDKAGAFDQKSFTVTLQSVALPLARDDSYTVKPGATLAVAAPGVLANDTDPGGGALLAQKLTDPDKGALSAFGADGSFTYVAPSSQPAVISLAMRPLAGGLVSDSTGYAWAADLNHDGGADVVTTSFGTPAAIDGKTGARLWTGWDRSDTSPGRYCLTYLFGTDFALGDVDGSGDITMIAGTNCDATYTAGVATRLIAVDTNPAHAVAGAARVKWMSERLDEKLLAAPSVGAPPVPVYAINTQESGLVSWAVPTLARLTPGGAVKVLTRILIGPNMFPYDRDGDGTRETYAGCAAATGKEADVGRACTVTFIVDAATGVKEATLTAPNPRNQYETQTRIPFRQLPVVVADLDGDGQVEIISGADVFKYVSGQWTLAWKAPELPGAINWFEPNSVAVADLDGDGKAEVILQAEWDIDYSGRKRGFLIYSADGNLVRSFTVPTWDLSMLTIADVDGDGAPEFVFSAHGLVYAYRPDGTMLWASVMPDDDGTQPGDPPGVQYWPWAVYDRTRAGNAVQVYDLQLDGAKEVIANGNFRIAIIDGRTGVVKRSIHHGGYFANNGVPMIVDADGDGHAEIFSAAAGPGACPGCASANTVPFAGENRDWAPAPLVFNQANYNPWAINDAGAILYDGGVHRSFRNQRQMGTVVDPRTVDTASFTYAATNGGGVSAPAKVSIQVVPQNSPPVITSTPPTSLRSAPDPQGRYPTFLYQITATDPDPGDTIRYELVYSTINTYYFPQATVDPVTGVVNMYTGPCGSYGGPCDMGLLTFVVAAIDSFGARAEQSFLVDLTYFTVAVPDVVGQQVIAAKDVLRAANLVPRVVEVFSAQPAGIVVAQDPAGGSAVTRGTTTLLSVSKGPQPVVMPFVVGKPIASAYATLAGLGLSVNLASAFSTTIPAGEVMTQNPAAGTSLNPATAPPVDLTVSAGGPLPAPIASIKLVPGNATRLVTEQIAYRAVATLTDGTGADVTLKAAWSTSVPAVASVTPAGVAKGIAAGSTTIRATVGSVYGDATLGVVSRTPIDTTPPVAQITSPADGASVTGPVDVVGTASDSNFLRYELAYSLANDDTWTLIAEGTTPVTNVVLGKFDPTVLLNDLYTLRLTVFDRGGNASIATSTVQVKGGRKVGLFSLAYTDLLVPAAGIPVAVTRTYDSRDKSKGDFGVGWRQGFNTLRLRTNRVLGTGWRRSVSGPVVSLSPTSEHKVSITLADGRVEEFDMVVSPTSNIGSLDFTNVTGFQPRPGTLGKLAALANGSLLIVNAGALEELVDDNTQDTYDPQLYRYTTVDGTQYDIGPRSGVTKVRDANGNTVTFGPDGIIHSGGQSVVFTRDAQGRIVTIADPMGNVRSYGYDGNGDLVSVVSPVNAVSRYAYDANHGLIEIRDASGEKAVRNEYDDSGRLVAVTDAKGNRVTFTHNDAAQEEIITDRRGNVRRLQYDADGNVLSRQQGVTIDGVVVNAITTTTYDALGNPTGGVNPDGVRVSATYAGIKPLTEVTDPGGLALTRTFTYNARNDVTAATDPGGRTFGFTYDGNGNVTSYDTPLGGTGTSVANAQGLAAQVTDALGTRTVYTRNAAGLVTREDTLDASSVLLRRADYTYDAVGNRTSVAEYRTVGGALTPFTTRFAYDAANRLVSVTDAAGGVARIEYDATGRVTARIDPLGRRTTFAFDAIGQPIRTTYPDGTFETATYDAGGNVVARTDRAGRTTLFEYDELDRIVRTTAPDGTATRTLYSAGGRVDAVIDARGNRTDYAYDAAGRPTSTTLPAVLRGVAGPTVRPVASRTLNPLGTPSASTDPEGRTTTFAYDAAGRLVQTTYADGTSTSQTYDSTGRRTSVTNEEGQVTNFAYDGAGRLTSVSGLAGDATYAYDEAGNLVAATDALGRTTRYRYDALNRPIETTYPDGKKASSVYDAVGNTVASTDPNGNTTAFVYDAMNRLTRKVLPGGATVDVTYTADDQRATVTDARGVTSYAYDLNGRLAGVTFPGGATLGYTRDANGNLLSLAAPAGTQTYDYDALNRLTQATTPEGSSRSWYDLAGNRLRGLAANGVVTDYGYDARNRRLSITHQSGGNVLESFANLYSPAGRRTRVTELDGSVENFTFDSRGRLISQTRTGGSALSIAHAYDAVGNRTQTVRDGVVTQFTYNANDQLISDGVTTYAYDANGNLVSANGGGSSKSFAYDPENRLRSAATGAGVVQYGYDAAGNRIETLTASGITRFLVDEVNNTGLSQVLEERDGAGTLRARYSYGSELLAMSRGGQAHFFHGDAQGSVRALSDAAATLSDRYVYEAYGAAASASGSTGNPYRYGGQRLDTETGLYQLRARFYDPAAARFLTRDLLAGRPEAPTSRHRYMYANSDPVDYADPTGLEFSLAESAFTGWLNNTIDVATTFRAVHAACGGISTLEQINEILFWGGVGLDLAIASAAIASNYDFGAGLGYQSIKFGPTGEIPIIDKTRYPTPRGDIDRIQVSLSGGQGKIGVKGSFHRAGEPGQIEVGFSGPPPEFKGGLGFKGAAVTLKRFTLCGMPASKDPNIITNFASVAIEPAFKVYGYLGGDHPNPYAYRAWSGVGATLSLDLKFSLLNDHFKASMPLMGGDFSTKGVNIYLGGAIGSRSW